MDNRTDKQKTNGPEGLSVQIQAIYHGDQVVEFVDLYYATHQEVNAEKKRLRQAHPAATVRVIPT